MGSPKTKDDLLLPRIQTEAEGVESTKSLRLRSPLWNFYKCYENSEWVKCIGCNLKMKKTTHSNLRRHLRRIHPMSYKKMEDIALGKTGNFYSTQKTSTNVGKKKKTTAIERNESPPGSDDETSKDASLIDNKRSFVWQYFQALSHNMARCKFCKRLMSSRCMSNLRRHLVTKHPLDVSSPKSTATDQEDAEDKSHEGDNEADHVDDDINFCEDPEDVKAILGLTGAQVKKTIEIIEHVDVADGDHYNVSYDDDNYNNEDDELTVKKTAKPILQKCLATVKRDSRPLPQPTPRKKEDNIDVLVKNIENKLRMMNLKQQVIAEYKIHEILFLGISNQLKYSNEDNEQLTFTIMDVNNEGTAPNDVR